MTKPTISDDEVLRFLRHTKKAREQNIKEALSDFLARRVPDARDANAKQSHSNHRAAQGFNACRDIVWNGRK